METVRRPSADAQRANAIRLYPHATQRFFLEAFECLGGTSAHLEEGIYALTSVPPPVCNRGSSAVRGGPVRRTYPRVTFRQSVAPSSQAKEVELIHPGHPLLRGVVELTLERDGELLKQGCIVVDERDQGVEPRMAFGFRHCVVDGTRTSCGAARVVSQRFIFVEVDSSGVARNGGRAPHLNY